MRRRPHINPRNICQDNLTYFPLCRSKGVVAAMVAALDVCRSDAECKRVWKARAQAHANALWRVGACQREIDFQLEELASAVCWELAMRELSDPNGQPVTINPAS